MKVRDDESDRSTVVSEGMSEVIEDAVLVPDRMAGDWEDEVPAGATVVYRKEKDEGPLGQALGFVAWVLFLASYIVGATILPLAAFTAIAHHAWGAATALTALLLFPFLPVSTWIASLPFTVWGLDELHWACLGLLRQARHWTGPGSGVVYEDLAAVQSAGKDGKPPTVICCHPHGIFAAGVVVLTSNGDLSGLKARTITSSFLYYFAPTLRIFLAPAGVLGAARKEDFTNYMKRGENMTMVPGGFHEATISCPHKDRVYLRKRKGFVKYALQHGYALTPVYTFGECDTFSNVQGGWKWRFALNSFGVPTVLFWGVPFAPLLPRRVPMLVVVGKPLQLPCIPTPTRDEVAEYHEKYIHHLQKLYDKFAPLYYGHIQPRANVESGAEHLPQVSKSAWKPDDEGGGQGVAPRSNGASTKWERALPTLEVW
ncbi:unnamed protein product [Vitrella brassicaformis CCMP3155]|uniref:Acyltransferase n=1 Tax=Vitrella brassicaformis (strain CCMP3155) TaxID=1169540 RepID=A0A0G4FLQ9_VITBC|nr:unnamed protein product [Vitrella brassicaformis CCMP3155]|eukprot:CEM14947.1 unnamed protein product [Vitrella brassicaformis CCMP3155]